MLTITLEEIEKIIYGESTVLLALQKKIGVLEWIHPKHIIGINKKLAIQVNRILYYGFENTLGIELDEDKRCYDKEGHTVYRNDELAKAYMLEVINQRTLLAEYKEFKDINQISVSQYLEGLLYMCVTYEQPLSDVMFDKKSMTEEEADLCFIMFSNTIKQAQAIHIKKELEFTMYIFFEREHKIDSYKDHYIGLATYMSNKENKEKIDKILLESSELVNMPGVST